MNSFPSTFTSRFPFSERRRLLMERHTELVRLEQRHERLQKRFQMLESRKLILQRQQDSLLCVSSYVCHIFLIIVSMCIYLMPKNILSQVLFLL